MVTEKQNESGHREATDAAAVSLPRRYALRVGYLVIGLGLAVVKLPLFIHHDQPWTLMEGVVNCMLAAMSILAFVGLRYPVRMLPLLLFEVAWKVIWLTVVALPLWVGDKMDPATLENTYACFWVVIVLAVVPWRYVYSQYVTKRGEPWR